MLLRTAGRQPITQQNSRSTCSLSPTAAQSRCPCGVPQEETFGCLTGNAACAPPRDRRALKGAPARAPASGFRRCEGVMTTPRTAAFNRAASDRARGDDISEESFIVPRRLQRRVTQPHIFAFAGESTGAGHQPNPSNQLSDVEPTHLTPTMPVTI